jgi:translation elongation factor EF-G
VGPFRSGQPTHFRNLTNLISAADVLGKVYGVVAKRRGRIVSEEMKEGTSFFTVSALLPVAESFGFADGMEHRCYW